MKYIVCIIVALLAFDSGAVLSHLYERTDDMSLRYNLWKVGAWPKPDHLLSALTADLDRQNIIKDKTKDEIVAWFPGSHEAPIDKSQLDYEKWDRKGRDHLWLANSMTVIYFENGRAVQFTLMKG